MPPGGSAHGQTWIEHLGWTDHGCLIFLLNRRQEHLDRQLPHVFQGLPHGRKRGTDKIRIGDIIEANDRTPPGKLPPGFMEGPNCSSSREIVERNQCSEGTLLSNQFQSETMAFEKGGVGGGKTIDLHNKPPIDPQSTFPP